MKDYALPIVGSQPSAILLETAPSNYELKNMHYNTLPVFHGQPMEDAHRFMKEFYHVTTTILLLGFIKDQLRMRWFSYYLKDQVKQWLMALAPRSLTTWAEVQWKFFDKYFPSSRIMEIQGDIATFQEEEG
ncbi:hypothetical protein Dsin_017084 [Dipteronia sinensis]|uniref:Retrotransposon gag domain-containing protein n=1 Tax=Dipteronia sinensis TaxID=43782 RepID=A0AAE0E7J7_9ROSI|nr:hypothetical protein Dsin_017084 [Dipteronia sinensis]